MLSIKEKYERFKPKKFLGQNFLVDENLARKIIRALEINKNDLVIEIGPGHGALTKHLAATGCKLIAVEIDKSISARLKNKFIDRLEIINEDFLKTDMEAIWKKNLCEKIKLVGNIPYNITSQILFKMFDNRKLIERAVIMMQKEVAMRLTAGRGTKDYGILAVNSQIFSTAKKLFNVPSTAFFPKPKVNSTVMMLTFEKQTGIPEDIDFFRDFLRAAFGKRRKTLRNSLGEFFTKYNIKSDELSIDLNRRAESLSTEEFVSLADLIKISR